MMTHSDRILNQLKEFVRTNCYIMTLHAEEEMDEDNLSIFDVEHALLTGKLLEKQKDEKYNEWKYLVHGQTIEGGYITVVVKISPTGKMVVITVFRDDEYENSQM
jgi:Domain of unknown function (DUF4258)